jgi:hypothetical protein
VVQAAAMNLGNINPTLPPLDQLAECEPRLITAYHDYVRHVSPSFMAMSLESARYILWLCETFRPETVCDFGSGFTSYVLRYYAEANGATAWSVDDSPEWLAWSARFPERYDLPAKNYVLFQDLPEQKFELVVYDYSKGETRNGQFAFATSLLTAPGLIVYDDAQHEEHQMKMFDAARQYGLELFDMSSVTKDQARRWAALGVKR